MIKSAIIIYNKIKLHRLIGILIFLLIAVKVDWTSIFTIIRRQNMYLLLPMISINLFTIGLKALRWQTILADQGIDVGYRKAFLYYASSIFMGFATPGRLGEFARALYFKQEGLDAVTKGTVSVMVDRVYDLFFLYVSSMFALLVLHPFQHAPRIGTAGLVLLIIALFIFPLGREYIGNWANQRPTHFFSSLPTGLQSFITHLLNGFQAGSIKTILKSAMITTASYCIIFFQCYLIAGNLSIVISFLALSLTMGISFLVSLLPISIMGIGTREAALMFFLMPMGLDSSAVFALSINVFLVCNLGSVFIGAAAWGFCPIRICTPKDSIRR